MNMNMDYELWIMDYEYDNYGLDFSNTRSFLVQLIIINVEHS